MRASTHRPSGRPVTTWVLRGVAVAGLAVDAYVHADLAGRYDPNTGSSGISQGELFRVEAGVAALAAVALLVTGRAAVWLAVFVVAGSALGGLLLYLLYDGALGPLPNMYEPIVYPEKVTAAVAEAITALTAIAGFARCTAWRVLRRRHPSGALRGHSDRPHSSVS